MIPLLEPIFQGDLAPFGERLACTLYTPLPPDALPLRTLLAPDALRALMQRQARMRGVEGPDLRAVASAWSLQYVAALMPPVIVGATLLRQVFPVGLHDAHVRLDAHGNPLDFHVPHLGTAMPGADTLARYAPLVEQHLAPLFDALSRLTRVAPKILWGNAAREFDVVFDHALEFGGTDATLLHDRDRLLRSAHWPASTASPGSPARPGRDNPMHGRQRQVRHDHGDHSHVLTLHRQCCLYHLLPGEAHCGACPLAPDHREAEAPAA